MKKQIATFLLCTTFLVSSLHALKRPIEIGDAANKNKTVVVKHRVTPVAKPKPNKVLVKSKARAKSKVAVKHKAPIVKRRAVVLKPKVVAMKRRAVHGKPKAPLKSKTVPPQRRVIPIAKSPVVVSKVDPRARALSVKPSPPSKPKVVPPKRATAAESEVLKLLAKAYEELLVENKRLKEEPPTVPTLLIQHKQMQPELPQWGPNSQRRPFKPYKREYIPLPKGYDPTIHGEHQFFKDVNPWDD